MEKYLEVFREIVLKFLKDLYMDDSVTGFQTFEACFQFYLYVKILMEKGGFILRKWATNDEKLQNKINENERFLDNDSKTIERNERKVLGITWDVTKDELVVSLAKFVETTLNYTGIINKRYILSAISSIYDPLGLLSPVVVNMKLLFQELCGIKLGWDEALDEKFTVKWFKLLKKAKCSNEIRVCRNYLEGHDLKNVVSIQLHGFSDASKNIYAAVVYIRILFLNGFILTKLVASKTRVAPLKTVSIPRLELMACLILSRLLNTVVSSLSNEYSVSDIFCWSDSIDCIFWINTVDRVWERFVQNRVMEIRDNVKVQWRYCPGPLNPADVPSRGLGLCELWLVGPEFLTKSQELWPTQEIVKNKKKEKIETLNKLKNKQITSMVVDQTKKIKTGGEKKNELLNLFLNTIIDVKRYSRLKRLLVATCYVLRFINNCKSKKNKMKGSITLEEINIAKYKWIKSEQITFLQNKKHMNELKLSLGAFIDDKGFIRVRGRMAESALECTAPLLLPKDSL